MKESNLYHICERLNGAVEDLTEKRSVIETEIWDINNQLKELEDRISLLTHTDVGGPRVESALETMREEVEELESLRDRNLDELQSVEGELNGASKLLKELGH